MADAIFEVIGGDASLNDAGWTNRNPLPDLGSVPIPHTALRTRKSLQHMRPNYASFGELLDAAELTNAVGTRTYEDAYVTSDERNIGWSIETAEPLVWADGFTLGVVTKLRTAGLTAYRTLLLGPGSVIGATFTGFRFEVNHTHSQVLGTTPNSDDSYTRSYQANVSTVPAEFGFALATLRYVAAGETLPEGGTAGANGEWTLGWPGNNRFDNGGTFTGSGNSGGTLIGPMGLMVPDLVSGSAGSGNAEIAAVFAWDEPVSRTDQVAFNTAIKPWLADLGISLW